MTIDGNGSPIKPLSAQRGGIQTTHLREKCVRDFYRCRRRPFQTAYNVHFISVKRSKPKPNVFISVAGGDMEF